jgi:rod shape determining protein RodA
MGFAGSIVVIGLFVTLFCNLSCRKTKKLSLVAFMDTALLVFYSHTFCKHCNGYWNFPTIGVPLPFSLIGSGLWGFTILLFIFLKMDANKVNEW